MLVMHQQTHLPYWQPGRPDARPWPVEMHCSGVSVGVGKHNMDRFGIPVVGRR